MPRAPTDPYLLDAPPLRTDDVCAALAGAARPYVLESGGEHELSRYLLAGCDPDDALRIDDARTRGDAALGALDALCGQPSAEPSGAETALPWPLARSVGYLGYELGAACDRFPDSPPSPLPDAYFHTYDAGYVVDSARGTAHVWGTTPAAARGLLERLRAARPLISEARRASRDLSESREDPVLPGDDDEARSRYKAGVARVQEYIAAGDIYQANIARHFAVPFGGGGAALFAALRASSPTPFSAWLDLGEVQLASASPERFLSLDLAGRVVETRPIKGTHARGGAPLCDARAKEALRASAKDRAEHVMIVDLERSDLGRVCDSGTVEVAALFGLETFAHLHHLVSVVHGRLRRGVGFAQVLRATFPGGSITGAPKLRAMEIIAEIERAPRGPCFGAFGWMDGRGRADLALAIRTAHLHRGVLRFAAGGGIVADSDPEAELCETTLKARGLVLALAVATPKEVAAPRPA